MVEYLLVVKVEVALAEALLISLYHHEDHLLILVGAFEEVLEVPLLLDLLCSLLHVEELLLCVIVLIILVVIAVIVFVVRLRFIEVVHAWARLETFHGAFLLLSSALFWLPYLTVFSRVFFENILH